MIHRYGRHGNKAWLRWRKRRFRRIALAAHPQLAVLNVPLEFLSQIRKVTIIMADGQERSFEAFTGQLPSPTVDADTDKHRAISMESTHNARERLFHAANDLAQEQAEKTYRNAIDPYTTKPGVSEARQLAKTVYYVIDNAPLVLGWSSSEAQEAFLNEFRIAYWNEIEALNARNGIDDQAQKDLLVIARTDKAEDGETPSLYARDRATIRAYLSFHGEGLELAEILPLLQKRVEAYQKFYDEFEPAKEED